MLDAEPTTTKVQVFRLTAPHPQAALAAAADAVAISGGALISLSMRQATERIDILLRLSDVEDAPAARLAERLARRSGCSDVRLEHCWMRP